MHTQEGPLWFQDAAGRSLHPSNGAELKRPRQSKEGHGHAERTTTDLTEHGVISYFIHATLSRARDPLPASCLHPVDHKVSGGDREDLDLSPSAREESRG